MSKGEKPFKKFLLFFLLIYWMQVFMGGEVFALDYPHHLGQPHAGWAACANCHYIDAAPAWLEPLDPDDIDDTITNQLCWHCHDNTTAPFVNTHSQQTTSAQYDPDPGDPDIYWAMECKDCHMLHDQQQVRTYGADTYLYQSSGSFDSYEYEPGTDSTTLTKTTAGWTEDQYNDLVVVTRIDDPKCSFKIKDTTGNTLVVYDEVKADCVDDVTPQNFAIIYGKLIRKEINTPNSGTKTVRFFAATNADSPTGDNSFADGDTTYDGVCEVCHTKTRHFRNDGSAPDQNHTNVAGGQAGNDCIDCHQHTSGFAHGGAPGGTGCIECHGHDEGTCYGDMDSTSYSCVDPEKTSTGAGTFQSHSTHTERDIESDADDAKGPQGIYCATCHDTSEMPLFKNQDGSGGHTLEETDICNNCHSPGGTYGGDNLMDSVVGAKANWENSIYEADGDGLSTHVLKSGKEKWCVTCHDEDKANSKADDSGVDAPNIAGDEDGSYTYGTGWGYYKTGHGLSAAEVYPYKGGLIPPPLEAGVTRPVTCDSCHDFSTKHIDGDARTFNDGDNPSLDPSYYRKGYRLKLVDSGTGSGTSTQEPLLVPWPTNTYNNENNHRLCVNCHTPGPFLDSENMNTNLVTSLLGFPNDYVPVNRHWYHFSDTMNILAYSSDWEGVSSFSSRITCVTCHNVHGSTRLAMVRDGKLVNREPGMWIWYHDDTRGADCCQGSVKWNPTLSPGQAPYPADLPLAASKGTLWIPDTTEDYLCWDCHADPKTMPEYRDPYQDIHQVPTLSWTGENGYDDDGVNPDSGPATGSFMFRVTYSDADNDAPTTYQLKIDKNDNDTYDDNADPVLDEIIDMTLADPNDGGYFDGDIYSYTTTLAKAGDNTFKYEFYFVDPDGTATGEPADTGGTVIVTNNAPTLSWTEEEFYESGGVYPNPGGLDDNYEFRIKYMDADNEMPTTIQVWVDKTGDGNFTFADEKIDLVAVDGDTDCTDGKLYHTDPAVTFSSAGVFDYRFYATDSYDEATVDHYPVTGYENQVTVLSGANTPPVLSWVTGVDCLTEGVRPAFGVTDEDFEFRVKYTDVEGDCASTIQVVVNGTSYDLDQNDEAACNTGRVYYRTMALSTVGDLEYSYTANDGTDDAIGTPVTTGGVVMVRDAIVVRPSGQGGDYNTIAGGIGGAVTDSTILVYPNTNFTAATYPENQTVVPSDKTDVTLRSACGAELTIIDGEETTANLFYFNNGGSNLNFTVDGFSLIRAVGSAFQGFNSASFTVKNSKIHDNGYQAVRLKTGISATLENCEIYNNCSNSSCTSAILHENSGNSLTIKGCEIYANGTADNGRGLELLGGTPTITDSIIRNHVGIGVGRAIYADNTVNFTVTNTIIKDNESTDNRGGAIYLKSSSQGTFNQCEFINNKAINSSTLGIDTGAGVAWLDTSANLYLTNSIVAGNQGTIGGAIMNKGHVYIKNSTFADNQATVYHGGAIWTEQANAVEIRNSIFWDNTAAGDGNTVYKDGIGNIMTVTDSSISTYFGEADCEGTTCSVTSNNNIDPAVDPFFVGSGDYHLLSISPVIDQAEAVYAPDIDIDGDNRPQGDADDMGADEYNVGPALDWTGEDNYTDDGANPDSGPGASSFEFRVDFFDGNNDAPTTIQVWVDENDNGAYEDNEKYDMAETDGEDDNYVDGKRYSKSLAIGYYGDGVITYRFYATDGTTDASGEPIYNKTITLTSNNAPTLEWANTTGYTADGVEPNNAQSSSAFTFRVKYMDADNKPPAVIRLYIDKDNNTTYDDDLNPALDEMIDMAAEDDSDTDYTDGKLYTFSTNLYGSDDNLKYRFFANDGFDDATGAPASDKTVLVEAGSNTAPSLEWADTTGYTADGVEPDRGAGLDPGLSVGTGFDFHVKYIDADNETPAVIQVWIDKNDNNEYEEGEKFNLAEVDSDDTDTTGPDGKLYHTDSGQTIPINDGSVTYRFYAKDTIAEVVTGDPVTGGSITLVDPNVVCASGCEYSTIQDAINAASEGGVVIVRDGVYQENIYYKDMGGSLQARNVAVQSENGPAVTSIVGTTAANAAAVTLHLNANNSYCVLDGFTIDNQAATPTTDTRGIQITNGAELTIRNCVVKGNESTDIGAGIYINGSKAMITNCTIGDATDKNTCVSGCGLYALYLTDDLIISDSEISYNENTSSGAGLMLFGNGSKQAVITNTTFSNNTSSGHGGAMYVQDSSFEISGSTFSGNSCTTASRWGGALYISNSSGTVVKMEVNDTNFTNNTATQHGGAISLSSSATSPKLIIDGGTFDNNEATTGKGGAIYYNNASNDPTIDNATFINNSAPADSGGAIFTQGTGLTITDTVIGTVGNGNTAEDYGGGIYVDNNQTVSITGGSIKGNSAAYGGGLSTNNGAPVIVEGVSINENTATTYNGGAFYNTGNSTLTLKKAYVQGNLAEVKGGGLYNNSGTMTLTNCIVSGNTLSAANGVGGGGIFNNQILKIYSSTIAGNYAPTGGGLYNDTLNGQLWMTNSIFWDNQAAANPEFYQNYSKPYVYYSDVEGSVPDDFQNDTVGTINSDPKFFLSDPASAGTPKTTGNYLIQSDSPCIDTGGDAAELAAKSQPAPPDVDIEGEGRPAGSGYEMGADEYALDPNATVAGTATAVAASDTSIDIEMPYSGDADGDNTYTVRYKKSGGSWQDFVIGHAHVDTKYTDTITGLDSGAIYDVEMTYNDGDGVSGTAQQTVLVDLPDPVAIFGSVYTDEGTTKVPTEVTVRLLINGLDAQTVGTTGGDYSFTVSEIAGKTLTVHVDEHGTYKATTVTVSDGNALSDLHLYDKHLITRYDNGAGSLTNANLATADDGDSDILYIISGGDLAVEGSDTELFVWATDTFAPGGAIDAHDIDVRGTLDSAANTINVDGNWYVDAAATFTSTGTVTFDAATGTKTINPGNVDENHDFQNVEFDDDGDATFQLTGAIDVNGNLTVTDGIFDTNSGASYDVTVGGDFTDTAAGRVLANSSLFTVSGNITLDANSNWTESEDFNNASLELNGSASDINYDNLQGNWAYGFKNLTVGQAGVTDTLYDTLAVRDKLTIGSGKLQGSGTVDIYLTDSDADGNALYFDAASNLDITTLYFNRSGSINLPTLANGYDCNIGLAANGLTLTQSNGNDVTINGTLYVDGTGDVTRAVTYDTNDNNLTVNGTIIIGKSGDEATKTFTAENSTVTVGGNFTINDSTNVFNATGSTVVLNGAGSQTVTSKGNSFNNLTVTNASNVVTFADAFTTTNFTAITADTQLTFTAGATYTISGTLDLNGQATDTEVALRSSSPGTRYNLKVTGDPQAVSYVDVKDSNVSDDSTNDITATSSVDTGNNDNGEASPHWVFAEIISGSVYTDEGTTKVPTEVTVRLLIDGASAQTTTTSGGDYSFTASPIADKTVTVHIDNPGTYKATTVTVSDGKSLTNMHLYDKHLITRYDNGAGSLTNLNLGAADDGDGDILYIVSGNDLAVEGSDTELFVWATDTFAPGGTVATHDMDINGTLTAGANAITVSGSWDATGGSVTTTGTTTFTSIETGEEITANGQSFGILVFDSGDATGAWTLQDALTASAFTLTDGVLTDNGQTVTVNGNLFIEDTPSILTSTGTWIQNASGNIQNPQHDTNKFYELQIAAGVVSTRTADVAARKFVLNDNAQLNGAFKLKLRYPTENDFIHIGTDATIEASSTVYIYPSSGTYTQKAINAPGVFLYIMYGGSRTIKMTGNWTVKALYVYGNSSSDTEAEANVLDTNGYNLTTTGTVTGIRLGNVAVGYTNGYQGKILLRDGTHSIAGDVYVKQGDDGTHGYFDLGSSTLSVAGDIDFTDATVTPGTSTVILNGTSTQAVTSSGNSFNNLTVTNASGVVTFNDAFTTTNFTATTADTQLTFTGGTTNTISGTLNLNGQATDTEVVLRSTDTSQYIFDVTGGAQSVSYVDVQYAAASSNNISATNSVNSGNNDNAEASPHWAFVTIEPVSICNPGCTYYSTIQDGIDAASAGETVLVADGTYSENIDFSGKNITVQSESGAASTIIQGLNTTTNLPVVTFNKGETSSAVLDGFTVNNQATADSLTRGIYISNETSSASPTIKNCIIKGNDVITDNINGAGIYIKTASATIESSTIGDATLPNTCNFGCGIYAEVLSAPLSISGTTIMEHSGMRGAGIYLLNNGLQTTNITGATISNNSSVSYGGAMYLDGSKVSISGTSAFNNNTCTGGWGLGGAIYATGEASSITLLDTDFTGNTTTGNGGAIYVAGSTETTPLSITGGTITGSGGTDAGGKGGAIFLASDMTNQSLIDDVTFTGLEANKGGAIYTQGALKIQNSSVHNNASILDGGGVRADGANAALVIDSSSVYGNTATAGGGILVENSGSLTMTNSDIYSNETTNNLGGGIYALSGPVTITATKIRGNKAKQHGGGIYIKPAVTVTLINCTVTGNTAGSDTSAWEKGGGIANGGSGTAPGEAGGDLKLYNTTIAGNYAGKSGGVYANGEGGTETIWNSIIWHNEADGVDPNLTATVADNVGYSDIEGGYTGTGNINSDPLFETLVQAGDAAPTPNGDFRISLYTSPVVEAGTSTDAPDEDYEGYTRPKGTGIDMGAYEYFNIITVTKTDDTRDGTCDADCSLREAVDEANTTNAPLIEIPAGTYTITRTGEDMSNSVGDFDVENTVEFVGAGADSTLIVGYSGQRVFQDVYTNVNMTFSNLTIKDGDVGTSDDGGCIKAIDSVVTIKNSTLDNCNAEYGGALYVDDGSKVVLKNATFKNNTTTASASTGGAIYSYGINATDSTFINNSANDKGGAIIDVGTGGNERIFTNCTFKGNSTGSGSNQKGGAINFGGTADITITNSTFGGTETEEGNSAKFGGAIHVVSVVTTTISDSTFIKNTSTDIGGAILSNGATISSSTFTENQGLAGGAIFNRNSSLTLNGANTFTGNVATGVSGKAGGAIYSETQSITINDAGSVFSGNYGTGSGGAIYVTAAININGATTFDDNGSSACTGGGAIIAKGGTINDSTFTNNESDDCGGALFFVTNAGTVNRSTFSGNSLTGPTYGGGAFYSNVSGNNFNNCTFYNNSASTQGGGAIYQYTGAANINYCTFYDNTASFAPAIKGGSIKNSIVANSSDESLELCSNITNLGTSLRYNGTCTCPDPQFINGDPKLSALADNGGSTKTMALQAGSAAIDVGTTGTCLSTDQRDVTRPVNGGISLNCDMGAYEYEP